MDEGLLSIISASCGQLVKMLITLEPHGNLDPILQIYLFLHCPVTGMQNGDKALLSFFGLSRSFTENAHNS